MRKKICNKCGAIAGKDHKCEVRKVAEGKKENKHKVLGTYKWKKKRLEILKRDGYICLRCYHKLGFINNKNLEVHHIKNRHDYPELIFDDNNLITVCSDCNKFYRGKNELDFKWKKGEYRVHNL